MRPQVCQSRTVVSPANGSVRWVRRLALVWIALPAIVIVALGRSCTSSSGPTTSPGLPAVNVLMQSTVPPPGLLSVSQRSELSDVLKRADAIGLVPSGPSPDPQLRQPASFRAETTAGLVVVTYSIGRVEAIDGGRLDVSVSSDLGVCQKQSVIDWSAVAVGRGEGCVAKNPGGGLFVEWIDRGGEAGDASLGIHVETTATDENQLLAWLSTWERVG